MLNIISTANASLQHCARSRLQHPKYLYENLLALADGLRTFSDKYKTSDLPAYAHADPGVTFARIDAVIRDLVNTVISAKYFTFPLAAEDDRRSDYQGAECLQTEPQDAALSCRQCGDAGARTSSGSTGSVHGRRPTTLSAPWYRRLPATHYKPATLMGFSKF